MSNNLHRLPLDPPTPATLDPSPIPSPGTGVIMSDEDILESLHRDGETLGHAQLTLTPDPSLMQIAFAWMVGLFLGSFLMSAVILTAWKVAKLLGLVT